MVYKADHTGPNNQFGGLNEGFCMVVYQVLIASMVKNEPTNAAR